MTYTYLTPDELVMREAYFHQETPVAIVAKQLKRRREAIYNVYNFLKRGGTAPEYFEQYKENKRRCGRTEIIFPAEEKEYVAKRLTEGWIQDVITLVERLSKAIIVLKPEGDKAVDIENAINEWLQSVPKNLLKSITFDFGKEFSNWKSINNANDIDIYFRRPRNAFPTGIK